MGDFFLYLGVEMKVAVCSKLRFLNSIDNENEFYISALFYFDRMKLKKRAFLYSYSFQNQFFWVDL